VRQIVSRSAYKKVQDDMQWRGLKNSEQTLFSGQA